MSQLTSQADALRGFNRFYTSAIGVITDRYLGQARPLGEARLLFEIGARGASVRDLRSTLDLDAGYLSRLLRSLQGQGLVQVRSRPGDSRARVAELTPAGRVELAGLNERATAVASGLLAPLSDQQRHELITALGIVERRLRLCLDVRRLLAGRRVWLSLRRRALGTPRLRLRRRRARRHVDPRRRARTILEEP